MKTLHTPVPWEADGDPDCGLYVTGPDRRKNVICNIIGREHDGVDQGVIQEDEANARLIAAAPDLLSSLETAVRWLRRLEQEHPGCLNADAIDKHLMPAIRKATEAAP